MTDIRDNHTLSGAERREASERHRWDTVQAAVAAAERVIAKAGDSPESDGSFESLLWITAEVSRVYVEKTLMMAATQVHRMELMGEVKPEVDYDYADEMAEE